MAIKLKLNGNMRTTSGKEAARKIRQQGMTPAIIYGNRAENTSISFNTKEFLKIVHGEAHENTIFEINIEGAKSSPSNVIIKGIQTDPVKGTLLHVDFYEINMGQPIQVHIPVEIKGEAIGVKEEGGLIDFASREIFVECLPKDLPEKIEIDVSGLKMGESIHIRDITLPTGAKTLESMDKVVLSIIHKLKVKEEIVEELKEEVEIEPEVLSQKSMKKEEE